MWWIIGGRSQNCLPTRHYVNDMGTSPVNVPLLVKKGAEFNINFAVLAKMDVTCKDSSQGSNNCDIRKMEVIIVDLANGKIYSHNSSSGIRSVPEDAMDEACKAVFRKFTADQK